MANIGGALATRNSTRFVLVASGAAVALTLLFLPLPRALETPVMRLAFDLTHVPLFAAGFLAVRWVLRGGRRSAAAAVLALMAGGAIELAQGLTSREASLVDLGLDAIGIVAGWTGVACWRARGIPRLLHAAGLVLLTAGGGLVLNREIEARQHMDDMMPLLAGFEGPGELVRWSAKPATRMERRHDSAWGWLLHVECGPGHPWPGVSIEDFAPDWRGYRWLEWKARLEVPGTRDLLVRIDDDLGSRYGDRFTKAIEVTNSKEVYRIDLQEVGSCCKAHAMNLSAVTEVHFFLDEPGSRGSFALDNVRLVR